MKNKIGTWRCWLWGHKFIGSFSEERHIIRRAVDYCVLEPSIPESMHIPPKSMQNFCDKCKSEISTSSLRERREWEKLTEDNKWIESMSYELSHGDFGRKWLNTIFFRISEEARDEGYEAGITAGTRSCKEAYAKGKQKGGEEERRIVREEILKAWPEKKTYKDVEWEKHAERWEMKGFNDGLSTGFAVVNKVLET